MKGTIWICFLLHQLGQYLAIPDNIWQYLVIPGDTWWYLVIPGDTWWYLGIPGDTWQCLAIPDNTWKYLLIPGDTWRYLTILLQYLTISQNTYQFPNNTYLVSAGIVLYWQPIKCHCQYFTSIAMVSSQCGTDHFVSVWYHHSTDSANFQKSFNA